MHLVQKAVQVIHRSDVFHHQYTIFANLFQLAFVGAGLQEFEDAIESFALEIRRVGVAYEETLQCIVFQE